MFFAILIIYVLLFFNTSRIISKVYVVASCFLNNSFIERSHLFKNGSIE